MLLDPVLFVSYLAVATALAISPGPDTMFVVASSASGGARAGVAATLGTASGSFMHASFAALGISALIAASPIAFDVLRLAGAVYLLWLGVQALRNVMRAAAETTAASGEKTMRASYRRGLITNLFNPKVAVFYVAFLPQFTNATLGHVPLQIFLLGLIHNIIGTIWLVGLALISGRAAESFARNKRIRTWLDGFSGAVYVALAVRMLLLERRPA
jgi:threonine/homoserine/homoserine lactone efflux protein